MPAPPTRPPVEGSDAHSVQSIGSGRRWVIPLLAGLLLVVSALPALARRGGRPVPQPVAFSHKTHAGDLGLGCEFCHKYFRTGAHSGLPDGQTCSFCHSVVVGENEEAARLTELLGRSEPLQFNKLFRLPDYVFYTHRRHVAIGGLECSECHGGIAETERAPERPLVEIKMAFCVDCHEERDVTTDCTACHR